MNHLIKILSYGIGGFALLIGSFVTFSALTGTPMHEMKGVGKLFPEQVTAETVDESTMLPDVEMELENDTRSPRQLFENAATPLGSFMLEDPFSADELRALEQDLLLKLESVERRSKELDERESEIEADQQHLKDEYAALARLRTTLLEQNADNEAQGEEVKRDRDVLEQREMESFKQMASLFEDTEPLDAAGLMTTVYGPDDAAKILAQLDDDRVRELIGAINELMPDESMRYVKALQELRAK